MLSNLTPPTDSFYKFLAIAGLILFLAGGYSVFFLENQKNLKMTALQGEEDYLKKEVELLQNDIMYNQKYRPYYDSLTASLGIKDEHFSDSTINNDSLTNILLYTSPPGFKEKLQELILKKQGLENKRRYIEEQENHFNGNYLIFYISLFGGELLAIFGFILWYNKIQKPIDEKHKKELEGGNYLHCQSCFKTFIFETERATEKNGKPSLEFCTSCYSNGEYLEPDLTFNDAKARLKETLTKLNYPKKIKKKKLENFQYLHRWKRLTNW